MSNILKDIAVLLFSAGEEIENKSDELKKERENRYKKFEEQLKEGGEKFKTTFGDEIKKARENIFQLTEKLGFASKNEIKELKDKIEELNSRLDKLSGKV